MNVYTFGTVEDCWRLFNNIKTPSRLGIIDFSVFKKDVSPAWEDETCRQGGRWIAKLDKKKAQECDDLWLNVVLSMVGEETFSPTLNGKGQNVCGAVISLRKTASKLAVWTTKREEAEVLPVGLTFQQMLKDHGHSGDLAFEDFASGCKAPFSLGSHAASCPTSPVKKPVDKK
jgi:translation initiation factor 4E